MIRIRFHGRGGQGIKTAGRIVGTAAFLAGLQVQDSPVYGAERRGAPVTAFTRIDAHPILERGAIEMPDLIVVADETLLDDRAAAVLAGQEAAAGVFVNAGTSAELASRHGIQATLVTCDISQLTLELIGRASALSAGLAAAAARLTGILAVEHLAEGVRQELAQLKATDDLIRKNVAIARQVFAAVRPVPLAAHAGRVAGSVHLVGYDDPAVGTASIVAPGNAVQRKTGTWRVECPEIDREICTRCGLCFIGCPEGAISLDEQQYPVIDYDHCKGCMICAQLCPLQGIARRREVRAW